MQRYRRRLSLFFLRIIHSQHSSVHPGSRQQIVQPTRILHYLARRSKITDRFVRFSLDFMRQGAYIDIRINNSFCSYYGVIRYEAVKTC